jgi:GxxExxY protein
MVWVLQELTSKIIAAAIEVHKHLGPGLLEIAYQTCLAAEFENLQIQHQREVTVPLTYKGRKLDCGFRVDFLIENAVVLELKSVEMLLPIHESQVLSYLRFMDKRVGLLLNFNESTLKKGIRRFVMEGKDKPDSLTQGRAPSCL